MNPLDSRKFKNKEELRKAVWDYMEKNGLVTFPRPCFGRIPNFVGVEKATWHLKKLREWQKARVIFSAPDSVLHRARYEALKEGKSLLVAAPRIAGFYRLQDIPGNEAFRASTIRGFAQFGVPVRINSSLPKIDLYLTGAVACDKRGNRIGKGAGFGDREDDILSEAGLIDERTPRAVLVHEIQVFEDLSYLTEEWDKKISIIVTPEGVYRI